MMDKSDGESSSTSTVNENITKFYTSPQLGSQTLPIVSLPRLEPNIVVSSSVVINIPPSSSPCSPRLAHLRPQNPLMSPLEMQRINSLLAAEPVDPSKLSPISPLYPTSDLGSSPRSSISVTTSSTSWGAFRDQKMSSSDFTDGDSDCKDLFSPGILLSPAPFSPFSDGPPETPATADFSVSPFSGGGGGGGIGSSPHLHQRLRFTFDPKSPSFFHAGRNFLLPPSSTLGAVRERSRSDSETLIDAGSSSHVSSSSTGQQQQQQQQQSKSSSATAAYIAHKKVFKKQILERYQTELSTTHAEDEGLIERHRRLETQRSARTIHQQHQRPYHTSPHQASVELPLLRLDPNTSSFPQTPPSSVGPGPGPPSVVGGNLQNQTYFDWWLKQQILAASSIWYPTAAAAATPLLNTIYSTSAGGCNQATIVGGGTTTYSTMVQSLRPTPIVRPAPQIVPQPYGMTPSSSTSLLTIKPCKRSRSESDMSYICQHCGQSFSLYDRLAKHIASRHRDRSSSVESPLKTHKCTVCHKAFGRSDMLTRHMRLHTGIKPYSCRVCGQVFSRSDHLSTHQRTHTGEKPYQCPQCSYAASRRDMITRHMRTHTRGRANTSSSSSSTSTSSYRLSSDGSSPGHETSGKQQTISPVPSASSSQVSVIKQIGDIRGGGGGGGGAGGIRLPTTSGSVADDDDSDTLMVEKARRLCVSPMASVVGSGRVSSESVSTIVADDDSFETAFENSSSSSTTSTASELTPRIGSPLFQAAATSTTATDRIDDNGGNTDQHSSAAKSNSSYDINQLVGSISEINVKKESS